LRSDGQYPGQDYALDLTSAELAGEKKPSVEYDLFL
jgi:hypothetical protein